MTGMRMNQALRCNAIVLGTLVWWAGRMVPRTDATYLGLSPFLCNIIGCTGA